MKFKLTLSIGFTGARHKEVIDIPDEELSNCETDAARDNLLQGYWDDWANGYIDGGICPADEDE